MQSEERWSWERILDEEALTCLTVTQEDMGLEDEGEPFIDLWFGLADPPQVGIPLLGEHTWRYATERLVPGEHLLVVYGNGTSSFRGSSFVRGGTFDRIRVEQGLLNLMFRDLDYKRLGQPVAEGAPHFSEGALFVMRGGTFDPGRWWDFIFLGSSFDLQGGFSREFRTFEVRHRSPKSVYRLLGPDPETLLWRQAWSARSIELGLVGAWLLLVAGVFAARRWTTASMKRLQRLHLGVLLIAFVGLGLGLRLQPSVTQLLTLAGSVPGEWRWGLFLSDPLLFLTWSWIAVVTLIWGRGVFCGWACPYGAFNELLYKLGRWLGLPRRELPDRLHRKARLARYGVLALLVGVFLVNAPTGELLAEVEPFKSTFFVVAWKRGPLFFGWWLVLAGLSLVMYRPFCRYICPLGAGLALPGSFRLSEPYRRDFCSRCRICTRGCEPRAIRDDGSIDPRECLNCWECEANWRDDEVCPPLVKLRRDRERDREDSAA